MHLLSTYLVKFYLDLFIYISHFFLFFLSCLYYIKYYLVHHLNSSVWCCDGLNVFPWSSSFEPLILSLIAFGVKGLSEVIRLRWGHRDGASLMEFVSLEEEEKRLELSLSLSLPHENTGRTPPSVSQKKRLHQELNLPAPLSWTSHSPKLWERNVCCLSHTVYDILWWQPQQSNTNAFTIYIFVIIGHSFLTTFFPFLSLLYFWNTYARSLDVPHVSATIHFSFCNL